MFEIAAVIVCLVILSSVLILLAVLLVVRAAQRIFGATKEVLGPANEHAWQRANALERERMVRQACGWRVIGRVLGAGALVAVASISFSSALGFACCLAAWRTLKPIKREMRDACAYRSTGAEDEPR